MDDARSLDAEPIRRRMTWRQADDSSLHDDRHDDDALADALAAEVAAVTSSIPVIGAGARATSYSAEELFAALMDDAAPERQQDPEPEADVPYTPQQDAAPEPALVHESMPEAFTVPVEPAVVEAPTATESDFAPEVTSVAEESPFQEAFLPSAPPENFLEPPVSASAAPQYEPSRDEWRDLALYPFPSSVAAESVPSPEVEPTPDTVTPEVPTVAPHQAESVPGAVPEPPFRVQPPTLVEPPEPVSPTAASASAAAGFSFGALLQAAPPPAPGSMAVPPPGSILPEPPRLRSLDDDALASVLNRTTASMGVAGALAELEVQMQLRDEDAREFDSWERSLRAIGTDEALRAIESARSRMIDRFTIPFLTDAMAAEPSDGTVNDGASDESTAVPPPPQGSPFDGVEVPTAPYDPFADSDPETASAGFGGSSGTALPVHSLGEGSLLDDEFADSQHVDETDWVSILNQEPAPEGPAESASVLLPSGLPHPAQAPHEDAPVLADEAVARQRVFSLEANNGEPTLLEYRAGRATRMFWQWFAVNSSVVSVGIGAVVFGLGLSVRQALVAVLAGVALSLLPLGLATLAGKWSGQPTMVVSRAAFGVVGNIAPALLAVASRVFWGGAILWVLMIVAQETVRLTIGASAPSWVGLAALGAAVAIATVVAVFGYALLVRFALILGVISAVLIVGLVGSTASSIDIGAALLVADGSWAHVVTGSVLVFSVLGLAWANAGSEVARYQRPGGSGASSIAFTMAGAAVPALLLIGYGVLLAASGGRLEGLADNPLAVLASVLPAWAPIPLAAAISLSLLCSLVMTVYSGGFSLQAAGVTLPRAGSTLVIAVCTAIAGFALASAGADFGGALSDAVTTLAVPVAAWSGIFACDLMIRSQRFDGAALMRRRSTYGDVNWVNLGMLLVATAIGFGFTSAAAAGLDWQGYLWPLIGVTSQDAMSASDAGVIIALALGLLAPLVAGVPRIRAQERASR